MLIAKQGRSISNVALRKESVDRNQQLIDTSKDVIKVALRKESVDRNKPLALKLIIGYVALRKESVDRNRKLLPESLLSHCRSPQGERG